MSQTYSLTLPYNALTLCEWPQYYPRWVGKEFWWVKWRGWQYQDVQDPNYMPNSTFWDWRSCNIAFCDELRQIAAFSGVLQQIAANCIILRVLRRFAANCGVFAANCGELHCGVLRRFAAFCSELRRIAAFCGVLQHFAAHCCELRRFAAYCGVLRRFAANCGELQRFAAFAANCGVLRRIVAFCNELRRFAANCGTVRMTSILSKMGEGRVLSGWNDMDDRTKTTKISTTCLIPRFWAGGRAV